MATPYDLYYWPNIPGRGEFDNPLGCEFDDQGRCTQITPCGSDMPLEDDCLSEGEPRAWSSPIYVDYAAGG